MWIIAIGRRMIITDINISHSSLFKYKFYKNITREYMSAVCIVVLWNVVLCVNIIPKHITHRNIFCEIPRHLASPSSSLLLQLPRDDFVKINVTYTVGYCVRNAGEQSLILNHSARCKSVILFEFSRMIVMFYFMMHASFLSQAFIRFSFRSIREKKNRFLRI